VLLLSACVFVDKELKLVAQQEDCSVTITDECREEDLHPFHGNNAV